MYLFEADIKLQVSSISIDFSFLFIKTALLFSLFDLSVILIYLNLLYCILLRYLFTCFMYGNLCKISFEKWSASSKKI